MNFDYGTLYALWQDAMQTYQENATTINPIGIDVILNMITPASNYDNPMSGIVNNIDIVEYGTYLFYESNIDSNIEFNHLKQAYYDLTNYKMAVNLLKIMNLRIAFFSNMIVLKQELFVFQNGNDITNSIERSLNSFAFSNQNFFKNNFYFSIILSFVITFHLLCN